MQIEDCDIDVGTRSIRAELYAPDAPGPHAGVVLMHELFGLSSHVRADARSLARAGYLVVAPDLYSGSGARYCIKMMFSRASIENRADFGPTAEVGRILDWLKARPDCNGKLGMIGMCLTGGFVLQMARRDDLSAPVVFHHSFGQRGGGMPPADAADVKHTVLGHFAEHDARFCPLERVAKLERDMQGKLDKHVYPGVGHGLRSMFRHTPQGEQSWQRTLQFFREHL
jgi:carboxymethylenebutenolidase